MASARIHRNTRLAAGQWFPDILFNGIPTGNATTNQFSSFTPFTITGSGLAGTNTLDFLVNNDGGPTGVRVEFSNQPVSAAPEPASLTLLGFGAISLMSYAGLRRRKKVKPVA